MEKGQWTEIFRAGDYGDKGRYTEADLDRMIANFNSEDQVPIVLGHPKTDSPAWGWIGALRREGDVLQGKVGDLHNDFQQALTEKRFKNRSVRIVRTDAGPKLLHLGFLGAMLPRVEGLKQTAQFTGNAEDCRDYSFDLTPAQEEASSTEDDQVKDKKIQELEDQLAAEKAGRQQDREDRMKNEAERRQGEFANFVEAEMIAKGKIPKEQKEEAVAFMMTLPVGEEAKAEFSIAPGGSTRTVSSVQWFKDFVSALNPAEFTRNLPGDPGKDFNRDDKGQLIDLSHCV